MYACVCIEVEEEVIELKPHPIEINLTHSVLVSGLIRQLDATWFSG